MKKSLILLSALAALGLAACGEKPTPTPDPGPDPVPVDVPTAEGKCTFYLTMSDSSVAMQSFGSIYLTGGAFGWKTGYDALELQKLEGDSKVYYVQVANEFIKKELLNDIKMTDEKEFKTGYSTTLKIVTMRTLDEYASKLNIKRSDVGRRIIEYFIEHNDVEDIQA